ncbi:CSC1-like protein At3g54510 isoform X2 [Coffea arabica]|uniref:CSC1-like protein At3g54510 isoform X2 n=1 Tax=Coffea arabica TaxID=13443 RepID=A0ABM4WJJ9_COFAR
MKAENLLASASINIGVAMFILSLFSILKKQPSNAPIYYPRRISLNHHIFLDERFTFSRFLPSLEWVRRASRVSEGQILQQCGLDVLVFIRLFKFGINFFTVSCVVGVLVLLPLNYIDADRLSSQFHSVNSFTISNIIGGSNRLWVHLSCLYFISCYGLYLLYKEYKDIWLKRIQQLHNLRHRPDQFTVLVREIPFCNEHKAYGCCVDHFFSKHYPSSYQSYQILYDCEELEKLLIHGKSIRERIEKLTQQSLTNRYTRRSDSSKIEILKEMLQDVCHKIRHIRGEVMLSEKELPVAFVTFRSRLGAALAAQSQQHSNPLVWITGIAPEPRDVLWSNLAIPYRHLPLHEIVVFLLASLLTIFFAIPVTAIQGIAKFEKLRKWFPPAMAVQLIPGLRSIVTGYLPSVILNFFIYIVPFSMIAMAQMAGYISRSKKDIKACNMVFYFLVGNAFFLSLLSGSLLDQIGESFTHPKDFPGHLAGAVSAQADFFMTYILTNGLFGFSLEILQPGLFMWNYIKSHTWHRGKRKTAYLNSIPYYRIIPFVALSILIGMIEDVYITCYETCGQYWPYIYQYILAALILMQITMVGVFGLMSKPSASISTIPLLLLTFGFNEYCKRRFVPTFHKYSMQDAKKNDELDEQNGVMETNLQNALDAYCPPCLRPVDFEVEESCSTQPLISPK